MAGIYGIFADSFDKDFPYYKRMFSSGFENVTDKQVTVGDRGVIGRSSLNRFPDDRFFHKDSGDLFLNEGVLLNYDRKDLPDAFFRDYRSKGDTFFRDLAGSYCGLIASGNGRKLILYNDFLSTRPVYYYHDPGANIFMFSSELKFFTPVFRQMGIPFEPNVLAWQELSVNGYLIGNHTLITGVEKLPRNSLLVWDDAGGDLTVKSQGADLDSGHVYDSKEKLYDDISSRLLWNIRASREKDLSYGYEHFQVLSGGLDSRLNVALAHHLGYDPGQTLTFTQSGTTEESCARAFGRYLGLNHKVEHLDGGNYLKSDLFASGLANDGLVMIHGAAQQYYNIRKSMRGEYGMLHSGQIGGAVFGSFTRWRKQLYEMVRKQAFFRDDSVFDRYFTNHPRINNYASIPKKGYSLYALEERMVNATFNGDIVCSHFTDSYSPFCDRELINMMYSQPVELLKDQKIYFDFLKARFPFILSIPIDRSFFKPTSYYRYAIGRDLMKVWRKLNRKEDMNPYQSWFRENPGLRKWLDEQYREYRALYGDVAWLQDLVRFDKSSVLGYLQPLTLFLAYDTHFGERRMFTEQTEKKRME